MCYCFGINTTVPAGFCKRSIAMAAKINMVTGEYFGCIKVAGYNFVRLYMNGNFSVS